MKYFIRIVKNYLTASYFTNDKKKDFFFKKKYNNLKYIILTSSDGYEYPLFHYSCLGLGNLILTFLYAVHLQKENQKSKIIPFYPLKIHALIKNLKYWYLRSSFDFNYTRYHFKRLLTPSLFGKAQIRSFVKKNCLYLSTDIINQDKFFFEKISKLDLNYVKPYVTKVFGVKYEIKKKNYNVIEDKKENLEIGLHLRRGDFKRNKDTSKTFNSSPDIDSQIRILDRIKAKTKCINIYSDQSAKATMKELKGKLDNYKIKLFPETSSASKVLEDMMKNDVIIFSNSTLSVISCMLTNQIGLFTNQILPSKIEKFYKNMIDVNSFANL